MTAPDTQINSTAWIHAWQRVLLIAPAARESIPSPFYLTPDQIVEAARVSGHASEFIRIPDVESLSDGEIFDAMFSADPLPNGNYLFIPDDCFRNVKDPYTVDAQVIRRFVDEYSTSVFDGDVLFISENHERISLFHHEGGYFHVGKRT